MHWRDQCERESGEEGAVEMSVLVEVVLFAAFVGSERAAQTKWKTRYSNVKADIVVRRLRGSNKRLEKAVFFEAENSLDCRIERSLFVLQRREQRAFIYSSLCSKPLEALKFHTFVFAQKLNRKLKSRREVFLSKKKLSLTCKHGALSWLHRYVGSIAIRSQPAITLKNLTSIRT